eukprot:PhF_6_TR2279/c0_g1_i1/m.3952
MAMMGPQSSKVSLALSATNLADKDITSKSDPMVFVYAADPLQPVRNWMRIGRTEVLMNNLNPKWSTRVEMDFFFERKQLLKFKVFDCDNPANQNSEAGHDLLGEVETELGFIIGRRGTATFDLRPKGKLTVTALELGGDANEFLDMALEGVNMKKMDMFGSCDAYLKMFRVAPAGDRTMLFQTEVVKNTLTPKWTAKSLGMPLVCGGKKDDPCVLVECWDSDMISDDSMGQFRTSVNDMLAKQQFDLEKPDKPGKKYGTIRLNARIRRIPTMLDYMRGGFQLNLTTSIDFTGSNGDPRNPSSLHYVSPAAPNQYMMAIMAVGEILTHYVTDKRFACFGFGGRLPTGEVSHCFPLSLDQTNPFVGSVQDILNSYGQTLMRVGLSGPTNFAPTISMVANASRRAAFSYTILLILTDGDITDMMDTIDAIVAADDAPLSIVIVGIGNHNFEGMVTLDCDEGSLRSSQGRVARRDLVQFVPFSRFQACPPMLAAEVLKEIPQQFVRWTQLANVPVPPPPPATH